MENTYNDKDPFGLEQAAHQAGDSDPFGLEAASKKKVGGKPSRLGSLVGGMLASDGPSTSKTESSHKAGVVVGNAIASKKPPQNISEGIEKDKEANSTVGAIYNSLVGSLSRLAGGIGELASWRDPVHIPSGFGITPREVANSLVDNLRTSSSSKENEKKLTSFNFADGVDWKDVGGVLASAPSQVADIGLGVVSGGGSFAVQAVNDAAKDLDENPNAKDLTEGQKIGYVATQAAIQAALDRIAVGKIFKGTGITKVLKQKIASEIVEDFAKQGIKATTEQIEKAAFKKVSSLATKIKSVGIKAATGFGAEGGTEAIQQGASDGIKLLTNKLKEKEVFDEKDIKESFAKNMLNAGVAGGVFGGVAGGGHAAFQNTNKAIRSEIANGADLEQIQQHLAEHVEEGNITLEEAEAASITAKQYAEIASKIPGDIEPEKKYAIIGGISQRESLAKDIETAKEEILKVDTAFRRERLDKLDLLEAKLAQTNDYIEGLVLDKKPEYKKEGDSYIKADGNGNQTEISKEHFDLADAIEEGAPQDIPHETSIIQAAIDNKEISGINADVAKASLNSEKETNDFLKEVAAQAQNNIASELNTPEQAIQQAEQTYGKSIVDLAIKKFATNGETELTPSNQDTTTDGQKTVGDSIDGMQADTSRSGEGIGDEGVVKKNNVPSDNNIASPVASHTSSSGNSYEEAKKSLDDIKAKHSKHFKKDGGFRTNVPEEVKQEVEAAYQKMTALVKQEREKRVAEDKRDTGLVDGIERIKGNENAYSLAKTAFGRGMIPDRQLNDFGKNLLHIIGDTKDEVTIQTAEIISDFIKRANVKVDDGFARELQEIENKAFEDATSEKPNKEQTHEPSVASKDASSNVADNQNTPPPAEPPTGEEAVGGVEENDWSGIRKEKVLQEIKGAKDIYEKHTRQKWTETMQVALEELGKENPGKSLYEAAKSKAFDLAQKFDKGESFNPTTKELAVLHYFKAETGRMLNELNDAFKSENDAERGEALVQAEVLENNLIQAAKAINPSEAGRAFSFRQSEVRNDPEYGLQIRRMDLQRANDGNPLSEADEAFLKDNWAKQEEVMKQKHDLEKKSMREQFDKTLEQLKKEYDDKIKNAKGGRQSVKDKTLSQKGKDVADTIRKLKFGRGNTKIDFTLGTWDLAVEGIAKLVEGGATVAEAIDNLIKSKAIGFKNDEDRVRFENAFAREISNQYKRDNAVNEIKKIADEVKSSSIIQEMVSTGLIKDFVDSHIWKVENEKLLDEAAKNLKDILPDTTKEELVEAYLRKGDFKQPTKKQLETGIRQQQKELQKIAKKALTADQVQKIKLAEAKQKTLKNIEEYRDNLKDGKFERPEAPIGLNKYDAELITLKTAEGKVEHDFKKKQRELEEKNKGWRERAADTARNIYVGFLIGGMKTFTKVGLMSLARPFSEASTKLTFGKVFDAVFPSISKAALAGGESSSWRSVEKGFAAYFRQMGAEKMKTKFEKSMQSYRDALSEYKTAKDEGVSGKELKKLEKNMTSKLLDATGNVVYQYIGGSSLNDAWQAFTHRNNRIEEKFGFAQRESFGDGNWLDKVNYVFGFIGRSHSALKTFSGRFSFAAGFMARLEGEARDNPQRLSEPNRLLEIAHESYLDFERGKYQQSNYITDKWNHLVQAADKKFIDNPEWNKYNKAWQALMRGDVAITRVPVNILHEQVAEYLTGTFRSIYMASKEVKNAKAQALTEGFEKGNIEFNSRVKEIVSSMDEKQAATIARCFRKGGLGLGLYAFFLISGVMQFGIYPHMGQGKEKDDDELGEDELNPDQIKIGDKKLGKTASSAIAHIPALWPALMGLGMAYQYDRDIKKGKTTKKAVWDAAYTHLKIIEGGIPQTKVISPVKLVGDAGKAVKKRFTEYGLIEEDETKSKTIKPKRPTRKFVKRNNRE